MRPLFLLLLGAAAAFSQPFSFGVKAGVPMTDFLSTVQSPNFGFNSNTKRYIVGPTVELRLPFGLGIELDALYRRLDYTSTSMGVDVFTTGSTTGNAWEFPLLAKYRFPSKVVRPYIDAGVAWDTLNGLTQSITTTVFPNHVTTTTTSNPAELNQNTTTGFVIGGGVDVHVLLIHLSPEIRYTRWGAQHFLSSNGGLSSNQNQAEFLLGITF